MTLIRRIFGLIVILTALSGIALSVGCALYAPDALDETANQALNALSLAQINIATTNDALLLAQETVGNVTLTLDTVEITAERLALSVEDTKPLLTQINDITTQRLPESLEAVENTLPNIAEVAGAIDDTLTALSNFGFSQSFFGQSIDLTLGIDYNPENRFDESIAIMSDSLTGLPEELRALETELNNTEENLDTVTADIEVLADEISVVNDNLADIPALLDEYIDSLNEVDGQLDDAANAIESQLEFAHQAILVVAIWTALIQLAPLYVGWQMLTAPSTTDLKDDIKDDLFDDITSEYGEGALTAASITPVDPVLPADATLVDDAVPPPDPQQPFDPNATIVDETPTKE